MDTQGHQVARALRPIAILALLAVPVGAQQLPAGVQWPSTRLATPPRTVSLLGPPVLSIGAADGADEELLFGVVGATRFADGGVAIADGSSNRILFFGPTGELRRTVGRSGDGPGEYRFLRWFGPCGAGALGAFDGAPPSLTVLSDTGVVRRRTSFAPSLVFQSPARCTHADTVLFVLNGMSTALPPGQTGTAPATVVRVSHGQRSDTIASGPGRSFYFATRMRGAYADVPLQPATLAAASRTRLFLAESATDTIRVLDFTGRIHTTFSLGLQHVPATRAHWLRAIHERAMQEPLERTRRVVDTVLTELDPPRSLPLIADLVADGADNVWVRTYDNYLTDYATWLVVSAHGRLVARVVAPRDFRPLEIGSDYVLGVFRDGDGVEVVRVHRLGPAAGAP
jgi:hypothetical protein